MSDLYVWLAHPDLPDNDPVPQPAGTTVVAHMLASGWIEVPSPEFENGDVLVTTSEAHLEADEIVMPPKAGHGSGRDAWVSYAEAHDVDVTDGMSRDDIIAAVEAGEPHTDQNKEA